MDYTRNTREVKFGGTGALYVIHRYRLYKDILHENQTNGYLLDKLIAKRGFSLSLQYLNYCFLGFRGGRYLG